MLPAKQVSGHRLHRGGKYQVIVMFRRLYRRIYPSANYRLRTLFGGRLAGWCRPTWISILLTNHCNARCVHCDIWKNRGPEDKLSLDEYRSLLTDLRRWLGPVHLHITGGEALLTAHAPDICATASELGFFVEFLTNGYWKSQRRVVRLARARPSRVTISMDGVGPIHNVVRGREDFWDVTSESLQTLQRVTREEGSHFPILLKTVIMEQNLAGVTEVARYAQKHGMQVQYQPIEQNYNTSEDVNWREHSPTWPRDTNKAVEVVEELIAMQQAGLPIQNSAGEFAAMQQYFRDPSSNAAAIQTHMAHEERPQCSTLGNLQIEPNGDVKTCFRKPPIGNLREKSIREIWASRPRWWEDGCCLTQTEVQAALPPDIDQH